LTELAPDKILSGAYLFSKRVAYGSPDATIRRMNAMLRRPAAVVFDMDGLLFDTEVLYREASFAAISALGYRMDDEMFRRTLGHSWESIRLLLLDLFGTDFPTDEFRTICLTRFQELADSSLQMKPGVPELLEYLRTNDIACAIATSSRRQNVDHHVGMHGIGEYFREIVAWGDYEKSKPAPDPYLAAAARLGVVPSTCLALEDSHTGVRSASSAGMMTVMVPDLLAPNPEIERLCVRIAPDLHAVRHSLAVVLDGK
jgi:HAD superfamily hydrolase (TIGR01509 family)